MICNCVKCITNVIHKLLSEETAHALRYDAQFNRIRPRVFIKRARVKVMSFISFISHALVLNLFCEVFLVSLC